jgi:hypothetical protein
MERCPMIDLVTFDDALGESYDPWDAINERLDNETEEED